MGRRRTRRTPSSVVRVREPAPVDRSRGCRRMGRRRTRRTPSSVVRVREPAPADGPRLAPPHGRGWSGREINFDRHAACRAASPSPGQRPGSATTDVPRPCRGRSPIPPPTTTPAPLSHRRSCGRFLRPTTVNGPYRAGPRGGRNPGLRPGLSERALQARFGEARSREGTPRVVRARSSTFVRVRPRLGPRLGPRAARRSVPRSPTVPPLPREPLCQTRSPSSRGRGGGGGTTSCRHCVGT
jgi:hypothetical protein